MSLASRNFQELVFVWFIVISTVHSLPSRHYHRNHVFLQIMQSRQQDFFTPSHSRTAMLYSKMGFYVAVNRHDVIGGNSAVFCHQERLRCLFLLESFGTSLVRMKNIQTKRYIAVSKRGKVYTTKQRTKETLLYQRLLSTGFTVFWSYAHHGGRAKSSNWYLGLKRTGDMKNAVKTTITHKSGHFFVMYQ